MTDLPYGIYEGEVVDVSPNNYTVLVDITTGSGTESPPVQCALLMQHGGPSDLSHCVSMPAIGSRVMVISPMGGTTPLVAGYIPSSISPSDQSRSKTDLDPLSANKAMADFRGSGPDDILPGDYSLMSKGARLTVQSDTGVILETASDSELSLTESLGISRLTTVAHEIKTVTPLFTSTLSRGDGSAAQYVLEANCTTPGDIESLQTLDTVNSDMRVVMGGGTPLSIMYTGSGGASSGFEIRSDGTVRIRGRQVEIDSYGTTKEASLVFPDKFAGDVEIKTDQNILLESNNTTLASYANLGLESGNSITVSSKQVTITSDSKNGLSTPGRDFSMQIRALQGGIKIEAGSELPTTSSVNKPGVRIQSAGGGDIHLASKLSAGGAFTSGTIVLSSPLPASSSGSGGLGNYGVVINSPLILAGNYPGFEDTPEGIPSVWPPPVPPIVDSYTKHFQYMLTLTGQLASVSSALTASFPITAAASVAAYTGIMSPFIASSSMPPIGRPISFVGVN